MGQKNFGYSPSNQIGKFNNINRFNLHSNCKLVFRLQNLATCSELHDIYAMCKFFSIIVDYIIKYLEIDIDKRMEIFHHV